MATEQHQHGAHEHGRHGHEHGHHGGGHGGHRPYDREMREADWSEVWERQRSREAMAHGWLDALDLEPDSCLVDVGSGPGFVSLLAAERVGPPGRVYAVDRAPAALDFLRERMAEAGVRGVEPLLGDGDAIPLPDGSATRALVANMLHHNDDPAAILREVCRVLAPGGQALIVEYDPAGSEATGPPAIERLPAAQVQEWVLAAGYARWEPRAVGEAHYGVLACKGEA
jgi:ubiquinone/menaquinone biosynthesis C-methylase UbiE